MGTSKQYGEADSMTAMDGFQAVGENGPIPDSMQEGYSKTLEHVTWKDSFRCPGEIIEDSKMMDLRKKPAAFIAGYYRTREKFGCAFGTAIKAAPQSNLPARP